MDAEVQRIGKRVNETEERIAKYKEKSEYLDRMEAKLDELEAKIMSNLAENDEANYDLYFTD